MLLDYENIIESDIVITAFKLINDNKEEIYVATYHNGDDILYKNFVFFNWYTPVNTDRMIIKHYGN